MNTVVELPNGKFDVQDESGKSVLDHRGGPTHTQNLAEQTARMLNAFDRVDASIEQTNSSLRFRTRAAGLEYKVN